VASIFRSVGEVSFTQAAKIPGESPQANHRKIVFTQSITVAIVKKAAGKTCSYSFCASQGVFASLFLKNFSCKLIIMIKMQISFTLVLWTIPSDERRTHNQWTWVFLPMASSPHSIEEEYCAIPGRRTHLTTPYQHDGSILHR
jgi:hypothetical protein